MERRFGEGQPTYIPTEDLTLEEDRQLASLLAKWQGGRISTPVFTELARMIPQPIVEVVVFRLNGAKLEALLIPRPDDDIVWPGMYHTPGSALRASDYYRKDKTPLNGPFERILDEVQSEFAYPPKYVGRLHRLGERGPDVSEIYCTELVENSTSPEHHLWYPVDQLAQNPQFIQSQLGHVLMAARLLCGSS